MKGFLFAITLFVLTGAKAQSVSDFHGKWIEQGYDSTEVIECPYQIHFETNYKYKVLNVCYGENPKLPITEEGTWNYDITRKILTLSNRRSFDNNDLFFDSSATLSLTVAEFKNDYLQFWAITKSKQHYQNTFDFLVRIK